MLRLGKNLYLGISLALGVIGAISMLTAPAWADSDAETEVVTGVASFVRHSTLNPLYCPEGSEDTGCVRSKTYWALSIQSQGSRYELDQMFAVGEEEEPELLQVAGVQVRPGYRLSVTARIQVLTRDYGVLTNLRKIELLDRELGARAIPQAMGWTCQSIEEAQPVYVDVIRVSREGGYSMRVQGMVSGEEGPRTIASFENVEVEHSEDLSSIRFIGAGQRVRAALAIHAPEERAIDFSSELKLNTRLPAYNTEIPVETAFQLTCGSTR